MYDLDLWKFSLAAGTTIAGGLWAAFVYFDQKSKAKAKPAPQQPSFTITQLPRGAVAITLAGLLLAGWAVATGTGDRSRTSVGDQSMTVTNGVAVGGDVGDSTISVTTGN